jgi:hypothetical protein
MTDKTKKTFLFTIIVTSFAVYCAIYYAHVIRVAPYKFTEFKSFNIKYGTKDRMINSYNSATGEYVYLNKHDLLVKKHIVLTPAELDSVHHNASTFGLWDFPDDETNGDTTAANNKKVVRYIIQFNYKRKSKQVTFDTNFDGPDKLIDANKALIYKIQDILDNAEEKQNK